MKLDHVILVIILLAVRETVIESVHCEHSSREHPCDSDHNDSILYPNTNRAYCFHKDVSQPFLQEAP